MPKQINSSNRFKIIRYSPKVKNEWDFMVKNLTKDIFFFNRDYLVYFKKKIKEHSLIIFDNKLKKNIGFIPGNINKNTFYSFEKLTFGGIYLNQNYYKSIFFEEIFLLFICYLKKQKIKKIFFKILPSDYSLASNALEIYFLNNQKKSKVYVEISTKIVLSKSRKFSNLRLRNLKKYKNIKIVKEKITLQFWKILKTNLNDKYNTSPAHNFKEISFLQKNFPNNIIFFSAYKDSNLLGGIVAFKFGDIFKIQYVGFEKKLQFYGAQDCIINNIVNEQNNNSIKILDFGISTENNGKILNKDLLFYKESFGSENINYYKIECDI